MPADVNSDLEAFINDLKKEKIKYSNEIACETVRLLERIVTLSNWGTAQDLMHIIRQNGKRLIDAQPTHTVVGNMVRRVLKIIRDEYSSALGKAYEYDQQESLQKMLVAEEQIDFAKDLGSLKKPIGANLRELMEELERSPDDIAAQSPEHIHFDEVIMTMGKSRTVEKFLKKAASKRKCQIIVAECAPFFDGHILAHNLAESGIPTTLIQDSAIFAILSRVNKVIIGTHSVMANGGLKAACGTHALALAAKHHSVPLIVLAPMFKLTPQYICSTDQEGFNHLKSSQDVMPFHDGKFLKDVQVLNPEFDYVPPDLVTLLVSNIGGNAPSYVYRLLTELYHRDDYNICQD